MTPLLNSVLTVLMVTALGWLLRRLDIVRQDQWDGFEHVAYQVFFPAVIVHSLISANLSDVPALAFGASILVPLISVGALLLAVRKPLQTMLTMSDATYSSVVQGSIRWNTFMAVSLAGILHGARGLALVAVSIVALIPLINVFTVLMLRRFGDGQSGSLRLVTLVKNPFIWSSLLGITLNLAGVTFPQPVMAAIDMCGKAALAAALLLVGSGLRLSNLSRPSPAIFVASLTKLLLLPVLVGLMGLWVGLGPRDLSVLLICASVPSAGAAYIMARQMGGDAPMMAAILTAQTIACIFTLPLIQWLFVSL